MRQDILDNVDQYSAAELTKYILNGTVTLEELMSTGYLEYKKRQDIKKRLVEAKNGDDNEWNNVVANPTFQAIQNYLNKYPNGKHRSEADMRMQQLLQAQKPPVSAEEKAWDDVDEDEPKSIQGFINKYPASKHIAEAKSMLENAYKKDEEELIKWIDDNSREEEDRILKHIEEQLNGGYIRKEDLLDAIRKDHNLLPAGIVKNMMNKKILTKKDLKGIGIDEEFIDILKSDKQAKTFDKCGYFDSVKKHSTEIYFWGIPSSGKSCALGAILNVAMSGDVATTTPDSESKGYGYMTALRELFRPNEINTLMSGTPDDAFYEMGFDLVDNENKTHPITCIDMAGELLRIMHDCNSETGVFKAEDKKENDEEKDDTPKDVKTLNRMRNILIANRSANRKIHIFVIEYGAENRKYKDHEQYTYLTSAVEYIKKTDIFKKDTDAVYIMISKADKAIEKSKEHFGNYIEKSNYKNFYNNLNEICKNSGISGGKVERLLFSLGEVCFKAYCRFDPTPAENFVKEVFIQRTASDGGGSGWIKKMKKGLKG